MFWRVSPSEFLHKLETSSVRSREFPDASCSSVANGSRQTGGPFLVHNGAGSLRIAEDSRFGAFLWMQVAPEVLSSSSSSSETVVWSGPTRCLSSSSSSSSWTRTGWADCDCEREKVTCFIGVPIAHATLAGTQDSLKSDTICPIVEYSTGEKYKPKAGHVILAPFGSSSSAIIQFCICGKENRIVARRPSQAHQLR